jgi:hypothetical protein
MVSAPKLRNLLEFAILIDFEIVFGRPPASWWVKSGCMGPLQLALLCCERKRQKRRRLFFDAVAPHVARVVVVDTNQFHVIAGRWRKPTDAIALQLDVTDRVSIADAAERIREAFGASTCWFKTRLSRITRKGSLPIQEYFKISRASNASLDEVRAVWETNVFGVLAVY